MKIEVEISSKEIIKPSCETPDHLRNYTLSYFDQISPKSYNPLVLFYEMTNNDGAESKFSELSSLMKKSLSNALALYYPLAGRVRNDKFVECNDEGISYSEAVVLSPNKLSKVLKDPSPNELSKLLPFELHHLNEFPVGIRLNMFSGGGVAIGICISHQLADALSCITFIKSWAALSRGDTIEKPWFDSAGLFPPRDEPGFNTSLGITTEVTSKRFTFASLKIESLREQYGRVSRVEALSAFILSRLLSLTLVPKERESVYLVVHPVNIRPRLDPPLPDISFGNLYRDAFTILDDLITDGGDIARKIREEIRKVDQRYLEKIRDSGEDMRLKSLMEEATRIATEGGDVLVYSFTSLCRFPLYDADFNWGDPLWVSSAALTFDNLVCFLDSKDIDDIEAYICLKEETMAMLQADIEFLKYAKL